MGSFVPFFDSLFGLFLRVDGFGKGGGGVMILLRFSAIFCFASLPITVASIVVMSR